MGSRCAGKFLRWSLILGLLYSAINPPFAVNDERSHFPRLHELSKGILVSPVEADDQYNDVPKAYDSMIRRYVRAPRTPEMRIKPSRLWADLFDRQGFDENIHVGARASDYTPIAYLPQFPAMYLGRWLELPTLARVYLARISSVVACSLLAACAVALAGPLRWAFFAVALMPMFLTQTAGVSGDGMTDALTLLFFALLAKGTFSTVLTRKELALLLALSGLLVYCKPPYGLFVLALFCLKMQGARPWLQRAALVAAAALIDGLLLFLWRKLLNTAQVGPGANYEAQWAALRANPLALPGTILCSLFANLDDLTIQLVAVRDLLSNQLRFLGGFVGALYLQLLLCLSLGVHARSTLTVARSVRAAQLVIVIGCTSAFYLAMLLASTEAGAPLIRGVQGRYFMPLLPGLLLVAATFGRPTLARWLTRGGAPRVLKPILAANALCLLALCARYYSSPRIDWPY